MNVGIRMGRFYSKCFFYAPSMIQSIIYSTMRDSRFFRPLHNVKRFPIKRNVSSVTPIIILYFAINPSTIGRFVIPIYINAVNSESFLISIIYRPFAKVMKAILSNPFITNGYSSRTIILVCRDIGIITSSPHILPLTVKYTFIRFSVSRFYRRKLTSFTTSLYFACCNLTSILYAYTSTIALAIYHSMNRTTRKYPFRCYA